MGLGDRKLLGLVSKYFLQLCPPSPASSIPTGIKRLFSEIFLLLCGSVTLDNFLEDLKNNSEDFQKAKRL